jgi:tripeptide aminopeptidase
VVEEFESEAIPQRPALSVKVDLDFDRLSIDDDHPVVRLACRAAENLGRTLVPSISGGGSDANVFSQHGIAAGVLGTGCEKVHTIEERVVLDDMVYATRHLLEIIRLHGRDSASG